MEQERHALQGRLMWPCAPQANTDVERAQNWAWCDRKESAQEENDFRGVLAMTLLWEAWEKDEAWPKLIRVHFGEESRLARAALADKPVARRAEGLHVLALEKADKRVSLGSISKEEGLTLAAERSQWAAVIPERVWWFQRATGHFADPCGMLNHVERAYLTQQLERMAKKCASQSQRLYRFAKDVAKEPEAAPWEMETRFKAVCALVPEAAFDCACEEAVCFHPAPVCRQALMGQLDEDAREEQTVMGSIGLWNGTAFAFRGADGRWMATGHPGEKTALREMAAEMALLEAQSPAWAAGVTARLKQLESSATWTEDEREALHNCLAQAEAASNRTETEVVLTWPWNRESRAAKRLLTECIGERAAQAAMCPFTEKAALLEAPEPFGDALLQRACCVQVQPPPVEDGPNEGWLAAMAEDQGRTALPPLTAELALALQENNEARLEIETMRVTSACIEGRHVLEATVFLRGQRRVCLKRRYDEQALVCVQREELPTAAVWPGVRMERDAWTDYAVLMHPEADVTLEAPGENGWTCGEHYGETGWQVAACKAYPTALVVKKGDEALGMLPNLPPVYAAPQGGKAAIAIDVGAGSTTVLVQQQGKIRVPGGVPLIRRLLRGVAEDEGLQAGAMEAITTSAVALTAENAPFYGRMGQCTLSPQAGETVYAGLKWAYDHQHAAARQVFLQRLMLSACLDARLHGVTEIAWVAAVPHAMAQAGRETFCQQVRRAAEDVARRTGVPLCAENGVRFADENAALGAYFRTQRNEENHGSFMALDVGGSGAGLSLWLRGLRQPIVDCTIPMGVQLMLSDVLLTQRDTLEEELCRALSEEDETARTELHTLLCSGKGSLAAIQRQQLALGEYLGAHQEALAEILSTDESCTLLEASLLLHGAFLLLLAGQAMAQAAEDPTVRDRLPENLPVYVAGRGGALLWQLCAAKKRQLLSFLPMGMGKDNPIRCPVVVMSPAPKLEVAQGLWCMQDAENFPQARTLLGRPSIKPEALMEQFFVQFHCLFPFAASRLFPNAYDAQGGLCGQLQPGMQAAAQQCFASDAPRAVQMCTCFTAWKELMIK